MSTDADAMKFVVLIDGFFPRPKFNRDDSREALWLRTMKELLRRYDAQVLSMAAQQILETRDPEKDGTMFPKPSECIAFCEAAKKQIAFDAAPLLAAPTKVDTWSDDRIALAFDLMNGPMGRRAADEGWLQPLYTFCRKNSRLPAQHEIQQCVADGRIVQSVIEDFRNRGPDPVHGAIVQWGNTLLEKQEELARKLVGGK